MYSWVWKEAEKVLKRVGNKLPEKGYLLFETGYGPSGLPHIGTFAEVIRSRMVLHAVKHLSGMESKLFCVSDDMDGCRKLPKNIDPKYKDVALSYIPGPLGEKESYGAYMNNKLQEFLNKYSIEYEFISATKCYQEGTFNDTIIEILKHYDEIMDIILPTLGEERRGTYSIFFPVCQETHKVLQVPVLELDKAKKELLYLHEGKEKVASVLNGNVKLQWKVDIAMRWMAFDVDFEMYGKDIASNAEIYNKICGVLSSKPPHQMIYELFLDEDGKKISKSKNNGMEVDTWLKYAPDASIKLFMYNNPSKAKKLYFEVIPKTVDEYLTHVKNYNKETDEEKRLDNPVYHIHEGKVPVLDVNINYSLLMNLVSACNVEDEKVIFSYLQKFNSNIKRGENLLIDEMVKKVLVYYRDFIAPNKKFKTPNELEKRLLLQLIEKLETFEDNVEAKIVQNVVYEIAKINDFNTKEWFSVIYEVVLGTKQGPRLGTFFTLLGIQDTINLIKKRLHDSIS